MAGDRIRKQRVKRRMAWEVIDSLGNVLLVLVLVAVPAFTGVAVLTGSDSGSGPAQGQNVTDSGSSDDAQLAPTTPQEAGLAETVREVAGEADALGDVPDALREQAKDHLERLPKSQREALYERHRDKLEARGVSPEDIESALND